MQEIHLDNPSDSDQRIDKFLKKYLPNAALGMIYKWLRTGKIKVNKKKVEQTYRLMVGDILALHMSDDEIGLLREKITLPVEKMHHSTLEILYEDDVLMVVNKPPNTNVHPGDHKTTEVSLIEQVQDMLGGRYDSLSFRPSLVHRIDRDTSGAIIIAKEKKALEKLLTSLQGGQIEKIYHTIVLGAPMKPRDTIRAKLLRREEAQNEAKVIVSPLGQEAITHYRILREKIYDKYSLLECQIETGRTHQIRVHMSHIGTPILGDKAYGNIGENSFARRTYNITRQMLHAYRLSFVHPISGKKLDIIAPYPVDFDSLLSQRK